MMMAYYFIALLSGVVGMYARYNFLQIFRTSDSEAHKFEKLIYVAFYITLFFVYFKYDTPILNLLVQLFYLSLLGLLMGLNIKKTILSSVIIITVLVAIDSVVFFMTGYVNESVFVEVGNHSIIGNISSDILILLISLVFKNYKNVSKSIDLPLIYWSVVSIFPLLSLMLMIVFFSFSTENSSIAIYSTIMILVMNLIVLWLYDRLIVLFEKRLEEIVIKQMNMSYRKQLEMMRTAMVDLKKFKHDIRSHIISIETLIQNKRFVKVEEYLEEIRKEVKDNSTISNTGNVVIDSIINYEINNVKVTSELIKLKTVNIPMEFSIKDYDLTVLLSNVFSNSLQAISNVEGGKIDAYIKYHEGIFFCQSQTILM